MSFNDQYNHKSVDSSFLDRESSFAYTMEVPCQGNLPYHGVTSQIFVYFDFSFSMSIKACNFKKRIRINLVQLHTSFGTMESVSVSSCSQDGSTSKKKASSRRKVSYIGTSTSQQKTNILRHDDSLRMPRGEKNSQSLDERRDDYLTVTRPKWHQLSMPTNGCFHWFNSQNYLPGAYFIPTVTGAPPPRWYQSQHSAKWYPHRIQKPTIRAAHDCRPRQWNTHGRRTESIHNHSSGTGSSARAGSSISSVHRQLFPESTTKNGRRASHNRSRVVFPQNITIPKAISPSFNSLERGRHMKRPKSDALDRSASPPTKKSKGATNAGGFDKLDLLCSATLDLGPLQENPTGCSCPKSRCIALYCDCFKAGRRCDPSKCSCLNCLNTVKESGPKGARSMVSATKC